MHMNQDRIKLYGLPVDEDPEKEEPAARVGPNGSKDRRSLFASLPEGRMRESQDKLWYISSENWQLQSENIHTHIQNRQFKKHRYCDESGGSLLYILI